MTDLTVVILTKNESLHIQRCLERLAPLSPREIFVVDSLSTDGTQAIVRSWAATEGAKIGGTTVTVVEHPYPGYQAAQFQWAMDTLPIRSAWVLRIDADEYLLPELIDEIKVRLPMLSSSAAGVVLRRRHIWRGKWMKRGMYPTRILRLFRFGRGKSDGKRMDEHIVVDGETVEFEHDFVDHSLISLVAWQAKHCEYARREAESVRLGERSTGGCAAQKAAYYRLPRYLRVFAYFGYRFLVKGAILEGPIAWEFCYRHALWYRWRVDGELGRKLNGHCECMLII